MQVHMGSTSRAPGSSGTAKSPIAEAVLAVGRASAEFTLRRYYQ